MTRLLKTNTSFQDIGKVDNYTLDLAFGDDENDFELTVPPSVQLERNTLIYVPETEWGGLIREESATRDRESGISWRTYRGATWHGLLDQRILMPPTAQAYVTMEGDLNEIIGNVVSAVGMTSLFQASPASYGKKITWRFDRFCTAWEGLRKMLDAHGCRLKVNRGGSGKTVLSAVEAVDHIESKSTGFGYSLAQLHPVNHLVCIGEGEMEERTVVHLFANALGSVSETQSIFGLDEVQKRYEFTTADRSELIKSGTDRLREYQVFSEADLTLPEGGDYCLDDVVGVADSKLGKEFTARISKIIVKCQSTGRAKTSFEFSDIEVKEMG